MSGPSPAGGSPQVSVTVQGEKGDTFVYVHVGDTLDAVVCGRDRFAAVRAAVQYALIIFEK